MKNCPVCNSSKYCDGLDGSRCQKCGYTNKSHGKIIKERKITDPRQISISQNYRK